MDIKQEYLSAAYPEGAKKNIGTNIRAAFANPLAQIALVGVLLALVQFLALGGVISSAFAFVINGIFLLIVISFLFVYFAGTR